MKKFLLGFLCGMAVLVATAASTSDEIKALISSTTVYFHVNGEMHSLDSSGDQALNYKGRIYIPLRQFTDEVGGAIHYQQDQNAVDVYLADQHDLSLQDKDDYVRMGYVETKFAELGDPSAVTGIIKFNKAIPSNKQIVIAILNQNGEQAAVTEPIRLLRQKVSQSPAGNIASFEAYFPYMEAIPSYQLQIQLVDKTEWNYSQVNGNLNGAGGINGYPLAMALFTDVWGKKGKPFPLEIYLLNVSDEEVTVSKPVVFEIAITQNIEGVYQPVRTLKSSSFSGAIPWKQGAAMTTLIWDQKDDNGALVPPGEYQAEIVLPGSAEGYSGSNSNEENTFTIPSSMKTRIPLFIE
ncbi:hypothetical protein [Paenibacillus sp. HB172176]|uniref:hypothetical protein n=1 Tax=Paenibacillus sp. HB172176 TaxID=2493690 RepID=UPI00143C1569|nr:hypothetical protein [Paenibacillus sp. HB172176]